MMVEVSCLHCGKAFHTTPTKISNGHSKYCSRKCRDLSRTTKIRRRCEICGNEFEVQPYLIKQGYGKYCSLSCRGLSKSTRVERSCETCGAPFEITPSKLAQGGGRYCSWNCYQKCKSVSDTKINCICQYCGKSFKVKPYYLNKGGGKYCSTKCANLTGKVWYSGRKRWRGPNWNHQRKAAYERDAGICQHCGASESKGNRSNSVHHIKPFRSFNGDYLTANQLTNLLTLCNICHRQAELGRLILQPKLL